MVTVRTPGSLPNNALSGDMKVYCENGALTSGLKALQKSGAITLVNFPHDPNSWARSISPTAAPSASQYRDIVLPTKVPLYCTYDELGVGSELYATILAIVGASNRRDALHVDSAYKTGCRAFITADNDILAHREELESLLGIVFLYPDNAHETLAKLTSE